MRAHLFSREGWSLEDQTAVERLVRSARDRLALLWGGRLPPIRHGVPELPIISPRSFVSRWLRGEKFQRRNGFSHQNFYSHIRTLLRGVGYAAEDVDRWIQETVFEEQGWGRGDSTARERLVLSARERVALRFGGILPSDPGIEGVPSQGLISPLSVWLREGQFQFRGPFAPVEFYAQVKALLRGLGVEEKEGEGLLEDAIFEEQGWSHEVGSAQERLLLVARRGVASRFGGIFPTFAGIEGVPTQNQKSALYRWLEGERMQFFGYFSPANFYSQVIFLLRGLGAEETKVRFLITEAVFEEQQWDKENVTAKQRLLLKAREEVAWRWGGSVPVDPDIEGIPHQSSNCLFSRWIRGEAIQFSQGTSLRIYAQVRALFRGVGWKEKRIDAFVSAAVAEEEKWQKKPSRAVERLVKATQEGVRADQNLSIGPEAEKVLEVKNRVIYTRWLEGGDLPVSGSRARREFIAKAAEWLRGVGVGEDRVRSYLLERLFKERGWNLHATGAVERLLLWAREEVALRYGGSLPQVSEIEGVSHQNYENSSLSRWLRGENLSSQRGHAPGEFYAQVRALLVGLGGEKDKIENAITDAVFEERGWERKTKSARDRLLLAGRERVAPRYGGVLPSHLGIEGIPVQGPQPFLTR
jgi:hypothetical protein